MNTPITVKKYRFPDYEIIEAENNPYKNVAFKLE